MIFFILEMFLYIAFPSLLIMVTRAAGGKFPEAFVKTNPTTRFKYSVYIIRTIYSENRINQTWAEVTKAANKRIMIDRLNGKKMLKLTKGKRIAIYEQERVYDNRKDADSYAMGGHGKMKML